MYLMLPKCRILMFSLDLFNFKLLVILLLFVCFLLYCKYPLDEATVHTINLTYTIQKTSLTCCSIEIPYCPSLLFAVYY